MKISQVKFCSLLSYSPRGISPEAEQAKTYTYALKNGRSISLKNPRFMPDYIADKLYGRIAVHPFNSFFKPNTVLVPIPGHAVLQKDSLWVPHQIASAIERKGLGKISPYLYRYQTIQQSYRSQHQRPTAQEQYNSIATRDKDLFEPEEILLIDEVITQGATILGCANLLRDIFPKSNIQAFAAVRVISDAINFEKFYKPCEGTVNLLANGGTRRLDN